MFFILNSEKAVLTADKAFMESVGTTHIFLLAERFRFGDFQLDEENQTCLINGKTRTFTKTPIQTILGQGYLYRIEEEKPEAVQGTVSAPPRPAATEPRKTDESRDATPRTTVAKAADDIETLSLSTPDVTETSADQVPAESESRTPPSTFSIASKHSEPGTSTASDKETLTLSSPDLPEMFEAKENDPLAVLDETAPAAHTDEEIPLPDWLETPEEKPAAPKTAEHVSARISEPDTEEIPLPDWLETPEEKPAAPKTAESAALKSTEHKEDDAFSAKLSSAYMQQTQPMETHDKPTAKEPENGEEDDLLDLLAFDEDEPSTPTDSKSADQALNTREKKGEDEDLLDLLAFDEVEASSPSTSRPVSAPQTNQEDKEDLFELLDMDEGDKKPETLKNKTATPPPPLDDLLTLKEEGSTRETRAPLTLDDAPSAQNDFLTTDALPGGDAPLTDYHANARMIGITSDEYFGFLRQFINESLQYEAGLKGNDLHLFRKNLMSIRDASQLLHLAPLAKTLENLEDVAPDMRQTRIDNFYQMIQHIRRDLDQTSQPAPQPQEAPTIQPEPQPVAEAPTVSVPEMAPLSLDAATPIPFDFSTKDASEELGLPEMLVQEFVADFVQQAKENISVFDEAYRKGDIDTIQKTAHLLKGAASNLRIDPLAETLKTLQYNEKPEAIPDLFHTFLGQLKTLVRYTEN